MCASLAHSVRSSRAESGQSWNLHATTLQWKKGERAMRASQHSRFDNTIAVGTLDGAGAADHDLPYRFGWRPTSSAPYPFSTRQYMRLLVLRGRVQDRLTGDDDKT
jgi:hypothetical protein